MKKSLFTVLGLMIVGASVAQTPSPSWTITQNAGFPLPSAGVRFLDAVSPNVVWAAGYDGTAPSKNYNWVSKTTNGGTTWTSGNVWADTNTYVMANLEGIDATTAWVSAYKKQSQSQGGIFRTTNGGASWVNMTAAGMYTNAAAFTNIVCFTTPLIGITQGDPIGAGNEFEIWRTVDGGNTWAQIPGSNIPNPVNVNEYGLVNVYTKQGNNNIWFGTNMGRIYYSNDAGITWNVSQLPTSNNASAFVNDIAFTDPLNGVAYVFISGSPTLEMFNTTDGGATWTAILPLPANVGRNEIAVVPGTNYFVSAGAGTGNTLLSYSNNNGVTWTDWMSVGIQYLNIDFADASSGWAGSFSDPTFANVGGIFKYNGPTLTSSSTPPTSNFTIPSVVCSSSGNATVTPVNSSTGTAPLTYSWSGSAGVAFASTTASAPAISFTANGTYTVTLEVSNSVSVNVSSQIIQVITCSSPVANFSVPTATNLCNNIAYSFTNTTTGSPTPTYTWSSSPAASAINPSPFSTNASISFSAAGVYSVTLLASNPQGTSSVTYTVNINNCSPVVNFLLPTTIVCANSPVTMTNQSTSSSGTNTYSWSVLPTPVTISNATAPSPTITFPGNNTYTVTLKATNNSGTTILSKTLTVSSCAGIVEGSLASNLSVYPNPATDNLIVNVSGRDIYNLSLVNVLGSVVYTESVKNTETTSIRLANLSKGIYFLTIESKGEKTTKKIIIE